MNLIKNFAIGGTIIVIFSGLFWLQLKEKELVSNNTPYNFYVIQNPDKAASELCASVEYGDHPCIPVQGELLDLQKVANQLNHLAIEAQVSESLSHTPNCTIHSTADCDLTCPERNGLSWGHSHGDH
jgi:hypothetical protein